MTLFAANKKLANAYVINDSCEPLAKLLGLIIEKPDWVAKEYGEIWHRQLENPEGHYYKIEEQLKKDGNPVMFYF